MTAPTTTKPEPKVYEWNRGLAWTGPRAEVVGLFLEELRRQGDLTTEAIISAARPLQSPIHELIEWDDKVGAKKFRAVQVQRLLQRLVVKSLANPNGKPVRAYIGVKVRGSEDRHERRYIPVSIAMRNDKLRAELIQRAKMRAEEMASSAKALSQLGRWVTQRMEKHGHLRLASVA